MRILILSDINSSHTRKWVTEMAKRGIETGIFSLRKPEGDWFTAFPEIQVFSPVPIADAVFHQGLSSKNIYLKAFFGLKKTIKEFKPDIVHAHYASSYGLLGALSGFKPFLISVWGSDVFDFPQRSFITRKILKFNLNRADLVFSSSEIMLQETKKYTSKKIIHLPFGVDPQQFYQKEETAHDKTLVVGTVKSLENIYGIDYLIKAFGIIADNFENARLLIIGDGTQREPLMSFVRELKLEDKVTFAGQKDPSGIPDWHRKLDIFVNPSIHESFGVAVLEASSTGTPVVATNTGGLSEVVEDGVTGILVPVADYESLAGAVLKLLRDKELRKRMGMNGRSMIISKYSLEKNTDLLIETYKKVLEH